MQKIDEQGQAVKVPSKYQQAIFDYVSNYQGKHLVVEALAGSGKTSTGVKALDLVPSSDETVFLAFNKHIANELATRLPHHVKSCTFHSLGNSACREAFGKWIKLDENKTYKLTDKFLDKYTQKALYAPVKHLTSLVKANLTDTSYKALQDLVDYHGIETNGDGQLIFDVVDSVIKESKRVTEIIDFDDMCWLPIVHDLPMKKYDFLFADEYQDLNANQQALIFKSINYSSRVVCVGDRFQAIYSFRGADAQAMEKAIEILQADVLPLSITYRCPKSHVSLVNQNFANIPLEAAEWAVNGTIQEMNKAMALKAYQPGDMVLCRVNKDLVQDVYSMIREGRRCILRGRDIGKGLLSLIKKNYADNIRSMLDRLAGYETKEVTKLVAVHRFMQADALQDKVSTISILSEGLIYTNDLERLIESLFTDLDDKNAVVFSTIHKAKGLEANRVFILRPDLMPHPMAKSAWEQAQEKNIKYVSLTRSKSDLIFVSGK